MSESLSSVNLIDGAGTNLVVPATSPSESVKKSSPPASEGGSASPEMSIEFCQAVLAKTLGYEDDPVARGADFGEHDVDLALAEVVKAELIKLASALSVELPDGIKVPHIRKLIIQACIRKYTHCLYQHD